MRLFAGLLASVAAAALSAGAAWAQGADQGPVKIGVLSDMSGLYSDIGGAGSVQAAKMAIEDFGGKLLGKPIELVSADHQNKPNNGASIARQWYTRDGVDAIVDVPTSSVALAVEGVSKEQKKLFFDTGAGASDITGKNCSPYTAHWVYDTYALAHGTGSAIVKGGGKTWFFLTADYAFGHDLERDTAEVVNASGGKVLGQALVPLNTADFSNYLLQAQGSKAQIVGLANAGQDTVNSIKQAAEFGLTKQGQKLAGLLVFITDVNSLGLPVAQGLQLTSAFYWDQSPEARAWSERFFKVVHHMPTMNQAGVYSALHHYFEAVQAVGSTDAEKVMAKMRETPINDFMTHNGKLRADGRVLRDLYLFQVKTPAESKGPWDYYKQIRVIPSDEAFRPLDKGGCPLVTAAQK
ncbi:MAG TPA: ABC transporter substrate-binding protein [Acetobacteraceae bacterium]|nr:ABC transporter substrate-binding protein [Acetobacteraceae bacterium]